MERTKRSAWALRLGLRGGSFTVATSSRASVFLCATAGPLVLQQALQPDHARFAVVNLHHVALSPCFLEADPIDAAQQVDAHRRHT